MGRSTLMLLMLIVVLHLPGGEEVHKTDGTLSGTYQVAEIFWLRK
jgi:hypothetical protein